MIDWLIAIWFAPPESIGCVFYVDIGGVRIGILVA